jgi:hypothetical protein
MTSERDSAIAAKSAAMLNVLATTKRKISPSTSQRGVSSIALAARPLPVTLPIRALTSWIAIMNGVVRNTVHSRP